METTEKIVEAYVRHIKGWATIANIKCKGQYEIDLLAIDPLTLSRYHIESGVSISGAHSKLTARPFDPQALKRRVEAASQRRTLGYFVERKFGAPEVVTRLANYGFREGNYNKVIVSWGWTDDAAQEAEELGILLWDFRDILQVIAQEVGKGRAYHTDDTLRTLQLFYKAARRPQ